ncbi:MAG: hypothetical protein OEU92_07025 [Alphaproteobacteria bacterium]|nr:hypothetical protein [Alphaproteobacteria bacterium]
MLDRLGIERPPSSLRRGLKSPTGAGKTTSAIEALKSWSGEHSVDILEPTHAKAEELLTDLRAAGIDADVERGFDCEDPDWASSGIADDELTEAFYSPGRMCVQIKAVKAASKAHVRTGEEFCSTCPFVGRCGVHRQKARLRKVRDNNGVIIKTHARVGQGLASAVGKADIIIVDEDLSRDMVGRIELDVWKLESKNKYLTHLAGPSGHGLSYDLSLAGDLALDAIRSGHPAEKIKSTDAALLRETAKLLRAAWRLDRPKINGERDPEKIAGIVAASSNDALNVAKVFDQVALAAEKNVVLRSTNIEGGKIVCRHLKKKGLGRRPNVVFMSANLGADRLSTTAGSKVSVEIFDADRNVEVKHVRTKATIARYTGIGPDGQPYSSKSVARAADRRHELINRAEDLLGPDARKVLFVTNTKLEQAFLDEVPEHWDNRHFGELAGLNEFSDHNAIVLVGQSWPPLQEIERLAAAVALSKGKSITTIADWIKNHPNAKLDDDGFVLTSDGPWHPDPIVRDEVAVMVEDQYDQAIGRLRAISSDKPKKAIICRLWLPGGYELTAEPESVVEDIKSRPAMDIYLSKRSREGFLPLTPVAAHRLESGLFAAYLLHHRRRKAPIVLSATIIF